MAQNTKYIKLTNNNGITYLPVTVADAVQYTYADGAMSVQQAIGTLASSQISIAEHLHDAGSDIQHLSASATNNVGTISLDQNGGSVKISNNGSSSAGDKNAHVAITYSTTNGIQLKVTYTDTNTHVGTHNISASQTSGQAAYITLGGSDTSKQWGKIGIRGTSPITVTYTANKDLVIDAPNAVTTSETWDTEGQIVVTNGSDKTAKTSSKTIATTPPAGSGQTTVVPTSAAVWYAYTAGDTATLQAAKNYADSLVVSAMNYRGVTSTSLTDGATTATITIGGNSYTLNASNAGDIVLAAAGADKKEFIWNGSSWNELGDASAKANKSVKIISGNTALTVTNPTLENDVTITHETTTAGTTNVPASNKNVTGTTGQQKVITSISVNSYGHVTSYTAANIYSTDNNTHKLSYNIVGAASGMTNSAQSTNGNVNLRHIEGIDGSYTATSTHKITGAGGVSVTSDASGNITITGPGSKDNNYSQIAINAQATSTTAEVAGGTAVTLAPASSADTLNIESVNKWVQIKGTNSSSANSDKIQIAHDVLWTGTPSSTQTLYKFTYDNAGHITAVTSVSADKVIGSVTSNYKIVEGNTIDDLNSAFLSNLGLSGTTGNNIATGNQTTSNYYHS